MTLSGDGVYCSVFRDDVVGEWRARHGITAAAYQAEFDKQVKAGFYPICVQGGGSGNATRYAAIFAKQDVPVGAPVDGHRHRGAGPRGLRQPDAELHARERRARRAADDRRSSRRGVIKLARAYTWGEPGYPVTQPTDRFLLASCSKMFLCAAVQSLYDAKKLTPGRRVYPLLGFSKPKDPLSNRITIQQLLDHMGGFDSSSTGSGYDPTYSMRQIANDLKLKQPVTKLDVARYMYKQRKLDFTPGTNNKYSNYGYLLASAVPRVRARDEEELLRLPEDGASSTRRRSRPLVRRSRPTRASSWPEDEAIDRGPGTGARASSRPRSDLALGGRLNVPSVTAATG